MSEAEYKNFTYIEDQQRAYLLGLIAGHEIIYNSLANTVRFLFNTVLKDVFIGLMEYLPEGTTVSNLSISMWEFIATDTTFVENIDRHIGLGVRMVPILKEPLYTHFIRGIFDGNGYLQDGPIVKVKGYDSTKSVVKFVNIFSGVNEKVQNNGVLVLREDSALNFLSFIYMRSWPETRLFDTYDTFLEKYLDTAGNGNYIPDLVIKFEKTNIESVDPFPIEEPSGQDSIGCLLTLVEIVSSSSQNSYVYDTYIKVTFPTGYYGVLYSTEEDQQLGFIIPSQPIVSDSENTVKVSVFRSDDGTPPFQNPMVKLVMKKIISYRVEISENIEAPVVEDFSLEVEEEPVVVEEPEIPVESPIQDFPPNNPSSSPDNSPSSDFPPVVEEKDEIKVVDVDEVLGQIEMNNEQKKPRKRRTKKGRKSRGKKKPR